MFQRLALLLFGFLFFQSDVFAEMYYWVDDQGIRNYATQRESIPEQYRAMAQMLSLTAAPDLRAEPDPEPSQKRLTRIPFTPGSPVLAQARINGAGPITLILDTGADRTMVLPSVLQKLGITAQNASPAVLKGVTGTSYGGAVWLDSIEVGAAKAGPLMIIIHESDLRGADGLLGRDFLAGFRVTMDSKEQVVTLLPN
jgi:hypothetical protein